MDLKPFMRQARYAASQCITLKQSFGSNNGKNITIENGTVFTDLISFVTFLVNRRTYALPTVKDNHYFDSDL